MKWNQTNYHQSAPLNAFKNKNATFDWTQCQNAFDILKQRLSQYPLLAFDDGKSKLTLKLNTDAFNCSLGGVLHQVMEDGKLRPIQYLSRSLSPREKKYSTVEKECLALLWYPAHKPDDVADQQLDLMSGQHSHYDNGHYFSI
ncbi:unnamed protein product [Didymodactylos carnosus]|uniref:Reverse transcriptase/retrotransposon-derived protein RNase H-like domain-containing protein n=1 Tax=Didymodactylos carnosus TaxID=1234261 RepID=A0A815E2D8_9BILA|nr:unnamed protein product [Didymodactylos carnosus]CAF4138256.1 unnamed protein product [Didymodactylos carnosus]